LKKWKWDKFLVVCYKRNKKKQLKRKWEERKVCKFKMTKIPSNKNTMYFILILKEVFNYNVWKVLKINEFKRKEKLSLKRIVVQVKKTSCITLFLKKNKNKISMKVVVIILICLGICVIWHKKQAFIPFPSSFGGIFFSGFHLKT
jgi:uncharacterized membrane protein